MDLRQNFPATKNINGELFLFVSLKKKRGKERFIYQSTTDGTKAYFSFTKDGAKKDSEKQNIAVPMFRNPFRSFVAWFLFLIPR